MGWPRIFPQAVGDYIRQNYKGVGPTMMAQRLNEQFGTSYTAKQIKIFYANHKLNSGTKVPFQKGGLPWTTRPIGYERVGRGGYVEVKVKMRPSRSNCHDNFVPKHRLIWEQTHGPVPPGCNVIFTDGDRRNFDLSNLALVTDAELLEMTRSGLFSADADLTQAGIMVARIKTTARQKKKAARKRAEEG